MVHEQKFKDLLSSTCQVSSERRVLDLESEVPSSILSKGNLLSLDFLFSHSKASNGNTGINANDQDLKTRWTQHGSITTELNDFQHNITILKKAQYHAIFLESSLINVLSIRKFVITFSTRSKSFNLQCVITIFCGTSKFSFNFARQQENIILFEYNICANPTENQNQFELLTFLRDIVLPNSKI